MKMPLSTAYTTKYLKHLVWFRKFYVLITMCILVLPTQAMAFTLQFGNEDSVQTPIVGDVQSFRFTIDIDAPLAVGEYRNPPLVQIDYRVSGEPVAGSPSGFPSFALSRSISGTEFYQAGNELVFEIADTAVLSDGIQAAELVDTTMILSFDAREEGTGRFHPARLVLLADGTGRLQNSDNVPDATDPEGIPAGSEYITDIAFDPGNLTLLITDDVVQPDPEQVDSPDPEQIDSSDSESSSGSTGIGFLLMLALCVFGRFRYR